MKLSEAIGLGRTLIRPNQGNFTLADGEGCACGMALAAVGETVGLKCSLEKHWPWTRGTNAFSLISHQYWRVVAGRSTLDQLIDFVRSIEPAEPACQSSGREEAPVAAEEPRVLAAK